MNFNSKWHKKSYQLFIELGFTQFKVIRRLSYVIKNWNLILRTENIFDAILVSVEKDFVCKFFAVFDEKFKFGTPLHGPVNLRLYGMNIIQNE